MTAPPADPRRDTLIDYPSAFPIICPMRTAPPGDQHDPGFDAATVELRESSGGKYLGVTLTVTATSREQLDNLYRALSSHPMVKVVF